MKTYTIVQQGEGGWYSVEATCEVIALGIFFEKEGIAKEYESEFYAVEKV